MDLGEDIGIPDDFSEQDLISGMWWRHLVAGGVAGAVSRSCTAPLGKLVCLKSNLNSDFESNEFKMPDFW